jgi:hypothetical protein
MRAEELLETLTDDELKNRANLCFLEAENKSLYMLVTPEEKLRLLTEADFYLKALIWRHDTRTAERDFRLEKLVISLISAEIVLSLIFGFVGLWEGWQQDKTLERQVAVLGHMDTSTAVTSDSLQKLVTAQAASLKILQTEEADRLAQLAKRPELILYVGHVPLAKARGPLKPTQETDTSATFDIVLKNAGEATADKVIWRALAPLDVNIFSNPMPTPGNDLPDRPVRAFLYFQDLIAPKGYTEVSITFVFPKGHPPFRVTFNASSPQIIGETPLGVLPITPRIPPH